MKRTVTIGAAVAALLLAGAGVASAQDARQPVKIDVGKACGVVTLTFTNPEVDVSKIHGFRWNAVAGNIATGDGARTGLVTVRPGATVKETIRFDEDEFDGTAAVTVAVAFGPDSDIQPRLDIYPVDTDCAPTVEPTEEPDPTTDPEPTDEPEPTDQPAPPAANDQDDAPAPAPGFLQVPVVPVGGVQTGGGPA